MSHRLYNYFISFHFSGAFAQLRLRGKIFEKEVRGIYCTWGAVPKQQLQQQRPPPPPSAPMRQQSFFSTTITNATMKRRGKKNVTTTTTKHHHHHPSSILIPIQLTLKIQYYHRSQVTDIRHSPPARGRGQLSNILAIASPAFFRANWASNGNGFVPCPNHVCPSSKPHISKFRQLGADRHADRTLVYVSACAVSLRPPCWAPFFTSSSVTCTVRLRAAYC